ncbi:MAG: glycosyltransferase [Nanoarchaeota archaeon]|nr:glycosyltransferase [Nanoarchaeota archaeon]
MNESSKQSWILYLGTYPPRECGIATFTRDLTAALDKKSPSSIKTKICAMNKNSVNIYNYPEEIIFQIDDSNIQNYIDTAKKINQTEAIKLINIQHEFGIFGGEYGSYLIPFLEIIDKPIIITLHSLIPNPNKRLKQVVQSLAQNAVCLVVMTNKGIEILRNDYGVNTKIVVVPHGIPTVPFNHIIKEKKKLGYENKIILTSFGLISSGKGYEYVIDALPEVVKKFPNVLYLILGETHPIVRKKEGEKYHNFLEKKIKKLGLQNNVKFYNKYLTLDEILKYLGATDIYISSGLDPNQITSGTLVYAMGCGRAVVSTPFLHAQDIVNHERGLLTGFNNPQSFADAIIKILSDPSLKETMERNAYVYTRRMTWPNVALSYLDLFNKHIEMAGEHELPEIKLSHLVTLTDDFGLIQFANQEIPDLMSGYTLDDNARAMIVCCLHYNMFKEKTQLKLIRTYLNFMEYVQQKDGRLYNFVDHNREINVKHWSDDAYGRALWALGYLISIPSIPSELKERAEEIFTKAVRTAEEIKSPRAAAFIIIGFYFHNQVQLSTENILSIKKLADHLVSIYHDASSEEWLWFEEYLTYSNSKLPEALFYAYLATHDKKYLDIAQITLNFLDSITFEKDRFNPIGQNGWYVKNGHRAHFDQQPIDVASMVQTLMLAYRITKKDEYSEKAMTAFQWFLGNNSLQQMVYDEFTGGCHDGLGEFSINLNKGAESTVSYLMARLTIKK